MGTASKATLGSMIAAVLAEFLLLLMFNGIAGAAQTCAKSVAKPLCTVAAGVITIQVEAEAELEVIGGYESARDEAFLNAAALVAETIIGLDCRYRRCAGINDVLRTCPASSVIEEQSVSYSADLQSVTWHVSCDDKNRVRIEATYHGDICRITNRLGDCLESKY